MEVSVIIGAMSGIIPVIIIMLQQNKQNKLKNELEFRSKILNNKKAVKNNARK